MFWFVHMTCHVHDMFTWLAILCCHLVCAAGETKSQYKCYADKKRPKNGKKLRHRMMHGKVIWKRGVGELAKASRGIAPGPHKGAYSAPFEPPVGMANLLKHIGFWPYDHKTQSFMKNGGQQKCLDKALLSAYIYIYIYIYIAHFYIAVYILDMTPCEPFLLAKNGSLKLKQLALITFLLLEYIYIYTYIYI